MALPGACPTSFRAALRNSVTMQHYPLVLPLFANAESDGRPQHAAAIPPRLHSEKTQSKKAHSQKTHSKKHRKKHSKKTHSQKTHSEKHRKKHSDKHSNQHSKKHSTLTQQERRLYRTARLSWTFLDHEL
jgi:hypothetical protein